MDDITIYVDDTTGKQYTFDGSSFKEFNPSQNQSGDGGGGGAEIEFPQDYKPPMSDDQPRIGDKGDQNLQDAEEIERQANKLIDDAGEFADTEEAQEIIDAAKEIKNQNDALKKAIEKAANKDVSKTQDEKIKTRLDKLKDKLEDEKAKERIVGETENAVAKDELRKNFSRVQAAKDARSFSSNVQKFEDDLKKFIAKEVAPQRGRTYRKINKNYAGSGIVKKGISRHTDGKVPLINVYFDRSRSWNEEKSKVGADAIGVLNNYVKRGEIKIDVYYFHNHDIESNYMPVGHGGTYGEPIVNHIKETKPDNVIILTDSDIDDIEEDIKVPGGVWLLFKGGRSQNVIDHIKGKKETKSYDI